MQADSKTLDKDDPLLDIPEKPTLTRTSTYLGVPFTLPVEQINVKVDETNVEVKRTLLHTQAVTDILDDLPDGIKEIVAATIST